MIDALQRPVLVFPLADDIISAFSASLSGDFTAYRNHVCRELNFFMALAGTPSLPASVEIAAAFHDMGIWSHHTFDYLPPSLALARAYLSEHGLDECAPEVCVIINEHHKISAYNGPFARHAELFRRADLIDLSLGVLRFGVSPAFVRAVRDAFPNAGFHRRLAALSAQRFWRSPLNPFPMFHW